MDGTYLGDVLDVFWIGQMRIQRDGSRLDGDATLLLILSCIGESAVCYVRCAAASNVYLTYASPALAAEIIPAR
jgi:hypothetical protein